MMEEKIFSGYCRCLDQNRMVTVEQDPGEKPCVDCSYGNCAFQSNCQVAQAITEYLNS